MIHLPHNSAMERCVLGCTLHGEEALSSVLVTLPSKEFFYEPRHQEIYASVLSLNEQHRPIDVMTLSAHLEERNLLEKLGGTAYLLELREEVPLVSRVEHYAEQVYQKAMLRRLLRATDELKGAIYEENADPDQLIGLWTKRLYDLSQEKQQGSLERIDEIIQRTINELHQLAKDGDPRRNRVLSGYRKLDNAIGGFSKGSLNILAARPSVGKSAFALNMAQNAALRYGKAVAIFSLEMSKGEIAQRFIAARGKLNAKLFRNFNELNDEEIRRLGEAARAFVSKKIFVDDLAGTSPMEILTRCRQKKMEGQLDLIIIDYLQLMTLKGRNLARQQEVSEMSRFLKLMAKELDVPVIALSQLNRDMEKRQESGEGGVREPQLSDLRESGSIEQDADTVLFLYRKESKEEEEDGGESPSRRVALKIAKNRGGPTPTFDLNFFGANYWFEEVLTKHEAQYQAVPAEGVLAQMEASLPHSELVLEPSADLSYLNEDEFSSDEGIPFDV